MEILTEEEAAKYLKIPESSLRVLRYKGKIPSGKIAGVVQYLKSDLDIHIENAFKKGRKKWEEKEKDSSSKNTSGRLTGTSRTRGKAEAIDTARIKKIARTLNDGALNLSLHLIKSSKNGKALQSAGA